MRLYELPLAFRVVDAMLDESQGEITPEIEAEMSALEGTLESKIDGIGGLIREATARQEAFKAEADRMAARAKIEASKADRLKAYVLTVMEALGRDRVQGGKFTMSVRSAGRPSIRWTGDGEIPARYSKTTVTLDGDKAYAAWKNKVLPEGFTATITKFLGIS